LLYYSYASAQVRFGIGVSNSFFGLTKTVSEVKARTSLLNPAFNLNLKVKIVKRFNVHLYGEGGYQRIKFKNEIGKARLHYEQLLTGVELNYLFAQKKDKLQFYGVLVDFAYVKTGIVGIYKDKQNTTFSGNYEQFSLLFEDRNDVVSINLRGENYLENFLIGVGFISENHLRKALIIDYYLKALLINEPYPELIGQSSYSKEVVYQAQAKKIFIKAGIAMYFGKMKRLAL
jgi:hypothetical protein